MTDEELAQEICEAIKTAIRDVKSTGFFYDRFMTIDENNKSGTITALGKKGRIFIHWELKQ